MSGLLPLSTIMEPIELLKTLGALGGAIYVLIRFLSILEKWLDKRADSEAKSIDARDKAYDSRDKQLDEQLRQINETQRQSLGIHERALTAHQETSRASTETSRLIAEEMRLNRNALEILSGKIDGVPSRTQLILNSDFDKIITAINEHNERMTRRVLDEIKALQKTMEAKE